MAETSSLECVTIFAVPRQTAGQTPWSLSTLPHLEQAQELCPRNARFGADD